MKYIYTRPDGGITLVCAAPKENIELILGNMTDEEYIDHIKDRSFPEGNTKWREITDNDIPQDYEFRDAWCDVTDDSKIDIDLVKAKEIKLTNLRQVRDLELKKTDQEFIVSLSKGESTTDIEAKKQILRDATNDLKALDVSGYNDEIILSKINDLGKLTSLEENYYG